MKRRIALGVALLLTVPLAAQTADETQVKEVIERLFTGMYRGDSALVHSTFADQVNMATALRNRENKAVLRHENSIHAFLKAVGTPHPEAWTEEIWNVKIYVDGDLAQAWCDYAFYVGKNFSHCGADAFLLHKSDAGWRIFHLADTRRKDCTIPEFISSKYK
jgi:hypothetical protein